MNIVSKRIWFFLIAAVVAIVCIVSLATVGIKTGIEFNSGSILNITFDKQIDQSSLRAQIDALGYKSAQIQSAGSSYHAR
jgi:preprotein translocase subunit SecF